MIKVGDKVVIVGDSNIGKQVEYGEIGVIAQVDHGMRYPYLVTAKDIDDGSDLTIWYPAASVKPYVEENWIENTTGVCPFKHNPKLLIDVKYRNGNVLESVPAYASFPGNDTSKAFWELDGYLNDIVAYRVVQEEALEDKVARLEAELAEAKAEIANLTNTINSVRDLV